MRRRLMIQNQKARPWSPEVALKLLPASALVATLRAIYRTQTSRRPEADKKTRRLSFESTPPGPRERLNVPWAQSLSPRPSKSGLGNRRTDTQRRVKHPDSVSARTTAVLQTAGSQHWRQPCLFVDARFCKIDKHDLVVSCLT